MKIIISHTVFEVVLLILLGVVGLVLSSRIDSLQYRLKNTQIDVVQATERSIQAERTAQQAKEMLDALQFSSASRR